MSDMYTRLTVRFGPVPPLTPHGLILQRDAFERTWDDNAEYAVDWLTSLGGGTTTSQDDEGTVEVQLEAHTKYEIDGDLNAAEAVSLTFPTADVVLHREWTGEESNTTRFEFAAGKRVRGQESQLVEVDPPEQDPEPVPHGHDVTAEHHADLASAYVIVEIPADGNDRTLAAAEITAQRARELSAELLRAANAAEFHYTRLQKEHTDA